MIALSISLAVIAVVVATRIVVFYFLARRLKAGTVTWPRVVGMEAATNLIVIAAFGLDRLGGRPSVGSEGTGGPLVELLFLIALIAVNGLVVKRILHGSYWKGTLVFFLSMLVVGFPTLAVVNGFLIESYKVSSNSMAPTLVGWHRTAACPNCGGNLMVRADPPGSGLPDEDLAPAICESCRQSTTLPKASGDRLGSDRFMVVKSLAPRRWDVIVFWTPADPLDPGRPSTQFVQRLVGLPGEEVEVRDGSVWINGERQLPPAELEGLRYETMENMDQGAIKLGDDEIFVLGDFSKLANDSRLFGPIPRQNIVGVASWRFFPLSRWKLLR